MSQEVNNHKDKRRQGKTLTPSLQLILSVKTKKARNERKSNSEDSK